MRPHRIHDGAFRRDIAAKRSIGFGKRPLDDVDASQADAINNNCLACHSADMVLNQPT
jgi:hypothetical protein